MLPLKDRVVIRQLKAKETTASGIILPSSAIKKPNIGRVIAVGEEVVALKPDMMVVLGTKWYTEFDLFGEELCIVNEADILGIADRDEVDRVEAEYGL